MLFYVVFNVFNYTIHFKFVVSLMCMTFCLIIKCLLELNFMQFYTFNVLETEVEWLLRFNKKGLRIKSCGAKVVL